MLARDTGRGPGLRTALISGIVTCVEESRRKRARTFLQGLSTDELEYISEFLGACMLESAPAATLSRRQLAESITDFDRNCRACAGRSGRQHNMVVLLECLCRCQMTQLPCVPRQMRLR